MLPKQLVPIVFGQGVQTKIDSKSQVLGTYRAAKNVVFETVNEFKKRYGYDRILLKLLDNTVLTNTSSISSFKSELLAIASNNLYGYSETLQRTVLRGPLYSTTPSSQPVLNNAINHTFCDSVHTSGFVIFAYSDAANTIQYSVKDVATGAFVVSQQTVGTGQYCKIATINNNVFIIYNSGADLKYKKFDVFAPATLGPENILANNLETTKPVFDVQGSDSKVFVAYNSSVGAARVRINTIDSNGIAGGGLGFAGSANAIAMSLRLTSSNVLVVAYASSTAAYYRAINFLLTTPLLSETLLETVSNIENIDIAEQPTTTDYVISYEIGAAETYNHFIKQNTASLAGVVGTPTMFKRSVGLAAKSFNFESESFFLVSYLGAVQATNFVLDASGTTVAKFVPDAARGALQTGFLPAPSIPSTNIVCVPNLIKNRISADNGPFFSVFGVNDTQLLFEPSTPYQNEYFANNLHFTGGLLQMYDGTSVVEHGFNVYPEVPIFSSAPTSGGFLPNGSYGFKAIYRWTDNAGQDHMSAPSTDLTVVLSGGGSTQKIIVTVPTLRLTAKTNVVVELYRTEDNGTVYYLDSSTANNPAIDSLTIESTQSDASLISKQLLYTTGDILENIAPPASAIIGVHTAANRVVVVGENRNQILYSKIREDGKPVEFNDSLLKDVDPVGGPITAIASMDEKLIIFANTAIFYISGTGPNNAGEQDSYTEPERVSIDVGCSQPNSVVLTPDGLMFKSNKGIYLLNRSLGIQYIGDAVEAHNNLTITSAKLVPDVNQVRFTTADGECLVYNFYSKQWATFTNHAGNAATVINNDYYYCRKDGTVFRETKTAYSDFTSPIPLEVETGWMTLDKLQGLQRVYKLLLLGSYKSPHLLRVQVAYDFNEAWVQDVVINPADFLGTGSIYGADSPYGSGTPYGGSGSVYQARIDLKRQKCQAIKFKIVEEQQNAGQGLNLSAFTLQVGVKAGINKVGLSRKFGTK